MTKSILYVFSSDVLVKLLAFISSVAVARGLGLYERGELAVIISLVQFLNFVAVIGLDEAIIYYLKEGKAIVINHKVIVKLVLLLGTFFYVTSTIIVYHVYSDIDYLVYIYLSSIYVYLYFSILNSYLIGKGLFKFYSQFKLVQIVIYTSLILAVFFASQMNLAYVLLVTLLSSLITVFYMSIRLKSDETGKFCTIDSVTIKRFIVNLNPYALHIFLLSLFGAFVAQLPIFYLGGGSVPKDVLGVFSVQYNISLLIISIVNTALFVVMVRVGDAFSFKIFLVLFLFYGVMLVIFSSFISDMFFSLIYGEEYKHAGEYFKSMLVGTFFWMGLNVLSVVLKGLGKPFIVMVNMFFVMIVMIFILWSLDNNLDSVFVAYNFSYAFGFLSILTTYFVINRQKRI